MNQRAHRTMKAMTTIAAAIAMPMMAPVDTWKTPWLGPCAPEDASRAPVFSVSVMVGKLLEPVVVAAEFAVAVARVVWDKERKRATAVSSVEVAIVRSWREVSFRSQE
jgi:hypothetical protein